MKTGYDVLSKISIVIIILSIFLMLSSQALAISASIGNARMVLRADVMPGEITTIEKYIKVNNVNDIPVFIKLTPDEDLYGRTTLLDNEITLQPGESKNFRFKIDIYQPGEYEGNVGVKFHPITDGVPDGSGVGLQSKIFIFAKGPESDAYLKEPAEWTRTPEEEMINPVDPSTDNDPDVETDDEVTDPEDNDVSDEEVNADTGNDNKEDDNKDSSRSGANPLVGIIIFGIIVIVGLAAYFIITRKE